MSDDRLGGWLMTYTGLSFWPLDPRATEIRIEDIAHALAMQCRWGGHCLTFYSVAEHCVRMARAIKATPGAEQWAAWGLLHDAAEAYLVDLPHPIKRHSDLGHLYREIEKKLLDVICSRFGLQREEPDIIHYFDNVMLMTEKRDLMVPSAPWCLGVDPLPELIIPWCWERAEVEYLQTAGRLLDGLEHNEVVEVRRMRK